MKIGFAAYNDYAGAGRATGRLVDAMRGFGYHCDFFVGFKFNDNYGNGRYISERWKCNPALLRSKLLKFLLSCGARRKRSGGSIGCMGDRGLIKRLSEDEYDIVNLHWIGSELIKFTDLLKIQKPLVFTMHDMWLFCGTKHYVEEWDSEGNPYIRKDVMTRSNPVSYDSYWDKFSFQKKQSCLNREMHFIAPSNWLAEKFKESRIGYDKEISVIPNPLPLASFKKCEKVFAREILGLPKDRRILLFGAFGGAADSRKGFDLLIDTLNRLPKNFNLKDLVLVTFGGKAEGDSYTFPFEVIHLGHLYDEFSLVAAYNAADLFVLPSRLDNLPQTGTEAISCGCPVVGFNVGGLPDIVTHSETGFLASPFDCSELAKYISIILTDRELRAKMSDSAIAYARRNWDPSVVIPQYEAVFQTAIAEFQSHKLHP